MRKLLTTAAMAAALFTSAAAAQPTESRPWTVEGTIEDGDRQADERRYDEHRVRLEAGNRYRLTATSDAFDPVLGLYAPGGTAPIAENDDAGGSLNSRIFHVPGETGLYTLRVRTFGTDGRGAYTLRAELLSPLPPATEIALAPRTMSWTSINGELSTSDPIVGDTRADEYRLFLGAGEEVIIRLDGAFDTVVSVYRAEERDGEPIDSDDDGGDGLNSMLLFRAAEAGDYYIRVTALGDGTGPYRLRIGQ